MTPRIVRQDSAHQDSGPKQFMGTALYKRRIDSLNLIEIKGSLVEHYNRALQAVTGQTTKLSAFHLDQRGESPEIMTEIGQDYLQNGAANRYMIVVSPNQMYAGLIDPEFSFDEELFSRVYRSNLSGIGIATRVDGLYGELENGVDQYLSLDDVILQRTISIDLHTPSGFIRTARELQSCLDQLRANPSLLYKNQESSPKKIISLAQEVGDIRCHNITSISSTMPISHFYTRLFDGVFVFRNPGQTIGRIPLKRPGQPQQVYHDDKRDENLYVDAGDELEALFRAARGGMFQGEQVQTPLQSSSQLSSQSPIQSSIIIYAKNAIPASGPTTTFIPLRSTERIVSFLRSSGYAEFDYNLISHRIKRTEDLALIAMNVDVASLSSEHRKRAISTNVARMPEVWCQLKNVVRAMEKGNTIDQVMTQSTPQIQSMLLRASDKPGVPTNIVEGLLCRVWPAHFEHLGIHDAGFLADFCETQSALMRSYISSCITFNSTHANAAKATAGNAGTQQSTTQGDHR